MDLPMIQTIPSRLETSEVVHWANGKKPRWINKKWREWYIPSLKLTARPWKWMVGTVSFTEGKVLPSWCQVISHRKGECFKAFQIGKWLFDPVRTSWCDEIWLSILVTSVVSKILSGVCWMNFPPCIVVWTVMTEWWPVIFSAYCWDRSKTHILWQGK